MSKTDFVRARVEPELKREVQEILHGLGLSYTEAINIFLNQVKNYRGIPFDLRLPNKETLEAMKEVETMTNVSKYNNFDDFYKEMDI